MSPAPGDTEMLQPCRIRCRWSTARPGNGGCLCPGQRVGKGGVLKPPEERGERGGLPSAPAKQHRLQPAGD